MADRSSKKAGESAAPKDPAAVDLGRRGGLKGGRARAASLTPERRREIAQQAAAARWEKRAGDAVESGDGRKNRRGRLNERLRQAFAAGAEEHSLATTGRQLTGAELEQILSRYPGSLDPLENRSADEAQEP
jgi:hypothetical protein